VAVLCCSKKKRGKGRSSLSQKEREILTDFAFGKGWRLLLVEMIVERGGRGIITIHAYLGREKKKGDMCYRVGGNSKKKNCRCKLPHHEKEREKEFSYSVGPREKGFTQ